MAAVESIKRAVKDGDLLGLCADRLQDLHINVNDGLGPEDYTSLHWACHYGKAEVRVARFADVAI